MEPLSDMLRRDPMRPNNVAVVTRHRNDFPVLYCLELGRSVGMRSVPVRHFVILHRCWQET